VGWDVLARYRSGSHLHPVLVAAENSVQFRVSGVHTPVNHTGQQKHYFYHCKIMITHHMIIMGIILNDSLKFRHVIVAWAVFVPLFFASIAGLGTVSLLRGQPAAWDGVINPRHDPAAIHAIEDVEQDAR
jgi:hypothetical protein